AYVEGDDPATGVKVMREIVEGLTAPLPEVVASEGGAPAISRDRLLSPGTEEDLQRRFLEENWTDKLPIVLPTEERVADMLAGTSHKPDEIVGQMQPTKNRGPWSYTVEKVAVNAVMAG